MFTFSVTINGVTVRPEKLNQTFKIDESLDSAILVIPFTTRQEAYDRFSRVSITIGDGVTTRTTDWVLYSDQIAVSTLKTVRYDHTIGLLEPTKLLEKYACGTLTFTQPLGGSRYTMLDVVERIRQLTPFVPLADIATTRPFQIDNTLYDDLIEIEAPQLYLDKLNLREALIEVLKYIDAIPRLVWVNDVLTLKADYINQRQLKITPSNQNIATLNLSDMTDEVSGENYATKVESYIENIIPSEDRTPNVYAQSITDSITFRNENIILGESDFKLILPFKISDLIHLKGIVYDSIGEILELDLDDYIFENDVYYTLDLDGGKGTKSHSAFWAYGSNIIDGFDEDYGAFGLQLAIENIISDAMNTQYPTKTVLEEWDKIQFKAEYVPFLDSMRVEQYREDVTNINIETEIQINQSDRINALYNLTNNLYGQIQRIGVDTLSVSKVHKSLHAYDGSNLEGIWSLGDYTSDGYFITAVELIYFNYFVVARYELSKNWNRIAQFINISKEFRPYEIALTKTDYTLKRDIMMNLAFVEVSRVQRMSADDLLSYNKLLTEFMKTVKSGMVNNENITSATLQTNFGNTFGVYMPLMAGAEKNVLKWKLDFNDTKVAGRLVQLLGSTWNHKAVTYTDEDGTFLLAKIRLFNHLWNYKESIYDNQYKIGNGIKLLSQRLPQVDVSQSIALSSYPYGEDESQIHIYDYDTEFPVTGEHGHYYVARYDTVTDYNNNKVYYYTTSSGYTLTTQFLVAEAETPKHELPYYKIDKDTSEILGFEMALPILPYYSEFHRFIIGDALAKDNALIKLRSSAKTLYIRSTNTIFTKIDSKTFTDITDSQALLSASIVNNYIDLSGYIIAYDNFAITDSNGNIYIAVNRRDLYGTLTSVNAIYFNFVKNRTLKNNIASEVEFAMYETMNISIIAKGYMPLWLSGTATPEMTISITASGFKQENYHDLASVTLGVSVVAYGIMFIPQLEAGYANKNIGTISVTPTVVKDEYSWFSISDPGTYDYNFTFSLPTITQAHYNKTARLSDGEIPPSYTYWRAL